MYITGIQFQPTDVAGADITYELLFEIGFGKSGNEVVRIQIPYSYRSDTAVGYYLGYRTVFLAEPVYVPISTIVSIRSNSSSPTRTINGVKLLVMDDTLPIQPTEATLSNNYRHVSAPSGISVTEKIR